MLPGLILSAALLMPSVQTAQPGPSPPSAGDAATPAAPEASLAPHMAPFAQAPVSPYQFANPPAAQPTVLRDTHLGPPESFWVGGDYLIYWLKPAQVPVLVAGARPGQPLFPLIGGREYEYGPFTGGRIHAGMWLNDRHTFGVGASGFMTEQRSVSAAVNSGPDGSPLLVRPFLDALLARPAELLVASPGVLAGGAWTRTGARLAGADLFSIRNLAYCRNYSLDFLAGLKYLDLDEYLELTQVTRPIGGGVVVLDNTRFAGDGEPALTIADRFRTRNQFLGSVLGFRGEYRFGPAFVNLTARGGIGTNRQSVDIDGYSEVAVPGVPRIPGGLLALQGANLGRRATNRFAVVTEVGAQFGVQVTRSARVLVGYDFLYLNTVARPGDQIDPIINTRLVPTSTTFRSLTGLTSPIRTRAQDDWYAHGVRLGMELQY
jgi:hypothetical protein